TDAFQIHVPTTVDLAPNLKGNLLLETGDMDNNVHPANTIRLVNALIKANKRFDFMLLPGKPHGYGDDTPYTNHLMFEYFAEHRLGDSSRATGTTEKKWSVPAGGGRLRRGGAAPRLRAPSARGGGDEHVLLDLLRRDEPHESASPKHGHRLTVTFLQP